MEGKGGVTLNSTSWLYESPLDFTVEDMRPHGGVEKFRTAAYSNVSVVLSSFLIRELAPLYLQFCFHESSFHSHQRQPSVLLILLSDS